jgi:hypothetical protein
MTRTKRMLLLCATVGTALAAVSSASAWTVDLTAQPSLKRTHSWKIEKSAGTTSLALKKGESATVSYSVTVGPAGAPVDGDWAVSGTMTMSEDPRITIGSVLFRIQPALTVAPHSCLPVTFPVNLGIEGLTCTYATPLPSAAPGTTWMRAVVSAPAGFRNAFAPFDFATATVNEVDECVAVTDSMAGALGSVCAGDAPKTFTYSKTIGPFSDCGSKTVDNTAAYVTNDSGATGSAGASVQVTVSGCEPPKEVCTRTIGYWKNHAGFGPQADVVTPLLPVGLGTAGGAKSIVVTTAAKAVSLLKMQGSNGVHAPSNGINKLYAQLLAAKLNGEAGASLASIAAVIAASDALLATHDSLSWAGLSPVKKVLVLAWMTKLDAYNNGLLGPAHCGGGKDEECRDDDGKKDGKTGSYGSRGGDDCDDDRDEDRDDHDGHDRDKCRDGHGSDEKDDKKGKSRR